MTHENVSAASIWTWGVGTLTATFSEGAGWLVSWFTSNPAVIAQSVATANQGGIALGVIGLVALLINRIFDDRKGARDNDARIVRLQADLDESRRKRHEEAGDWNRRLLEQQDRLAEVQSGVKANTVAINKTLPVVKATAEKSGVNLPIADLVKPLEEPPVDDKV